MIYLQQTIIINDLHQDESHNHPLFFRIALAILLLHTGILHAQKLIIPRDYDPVFKEIRPLYQQDTIKIRFFGDIMMHSMQIETAHQGNDQYNFSSYFAHMMDYLNDSDLNVGNMEFTLGGKPYTGYPSFSAPDCFAEYLAECGFGLFLCANNHIFDKGSIGVKRTLDAYCDLAGSYDIYYTGAATDTIGQRKSTPLIINIKGVIISFINATYGTNSPKGNGWPRTNILSDKITLGKALEEARKKSDIVIALVHWGDEYILKHSKKQEEDAEWLAFNGADIIIGSHPHVIQDTDTIRVNGKEIPVIYSLGNCVSNMSAKNTQAGLMVTLSIIRHNNGDITMNKPEYRYTWCSRPGGYGDSYYLLPIRDFADKENEWYGKWDYQKMMETMKRVSQETGITENQNIK